jgi:hypothetical protein
MGAGLECYDASGQLMFTNEDALGRIIGKINVVGANGNGSFVDTNLISGRSFALFLGTTTGQYWTRCHVAVSGQTVSWWFENYAGKPGMNNPSGFIIYGLF